MSKKFRELAIARLERIEDYLRTLGNDYTESDYQVDDFLRVWGKQPVRPSGRNPYEGIFTVQEVADNGEQTVLGVPYYSQRDNYRDADRTCFSSACAMLLKFLEPNSIKGDDDYIKRVFEIGDTTRADVQVQALASFGLKSVFETNSSYRQISELLNAGIPVPIGFLHHGTDDNPSGGGHWAVVIGETAIDWIVHDPWGDLYSDFLDQDGKAVKYNKRSFTKRFMPNGEGSGWLIKALPSNSKKETSNRGIELIKKYEGLKLDAYLCPAGVWTIGWGHTAEVKQGDRITAHKAEEYLRGDMVLFENAVNRLVKVPLTQNQFDALVSFAFNVGVGALENSTLLRMLNQGNYKEASEQFARWNKGDGKVLEGLVRRRAEEKSLFLNKE